MWQMYSPLTKRCCKSWLWITTDVRSDHLCTAGTPGQWLPCFYDHNPAAESAWEVQIRLTSLFSRPATSATSMARTWRPWWRGWRWLLLWHRRAPSRGLAPSSGTRSQCLDVRRISCGVMNIGLVWAGTTHLHFITIQVLLKWMYPSDTGFLI